MQSTFDETYRAAANRITAGDALKQRTLRAVNAASAARRAWWPKLAGFTCMACACAALVLFFPSISKSSADMNAPMSAATAGAADTGGQLDGAPQGHTSPSLYGALETQPEIAEQDPSAPPEITGYQSDIVWGGGELHFSESESGSPARKTVMDENAEQVTLTPDEYLAYLGRDPRPAWLPADLTVQSPAEGSPRILYRSREGDSICECFSYTFSEPLPDGIAYDPTQRRLTMEVARDAVPLRDYGFLQEEETASYIGGVPLSVGRAVMTYGPYDAETHAPAGSYDVYTAEFVYDGIGYFLYSDNLTQQEFIKILCSLFPAGE